MTMTSKQNIDKSRLRREELRNFYGSEQNGDQNLDINSKKFEPDLHVKKMIKEKNLKQLLEEESNLVNSIQKLDSECQTLVYDHYDKFIAATDIVRQMKEGSAQMNVQASELQEKMAKITVASESITHDLQERRGKLSHLLGIHSTLKKLQFLFHLPHKIDECVKEKMFSEGVKSYVETAEVLTKYQHLPSFSSIHRDCEDSLRRLNAALKSELAINDGSTQHLTLCVDLLLQLGEPTEDLCENFLRQARSKLEQDLSHLRTLTGVESAPLNRGVSDEKVRLLSTHPTHNDGCYSEKKQLDTTYPADADQGLLDILQFVDVCHDTFVANLWLVISSYKGMFLRGADDNDYRITLDPRASVAQLKLQEFVFALMDEYVGVVSVRLAAKEEDGDTDDYQALTTALDKFHRRLHAVSQLLRNSNFNEKSLDLIMEAAECRCKASLRWMQKRFLSHLTDVRQSLVSSRSSGGDNSPSMQLNELLTHLVASTAADIKDRIEALLAFIEPKHTFAMRSDFRHRFTRELVREGVVVSFFVFMTDSLGGFSRGREKDPSLLLLLSRMCLDLHTSTVHYMFNHCDEQLQLEDKRGLTPYSAITSNMKEAGQKLLNHYVTSQGSSISQMLRRSVELKDWLGCSEPRSVRRVMKTVRDELSSIDILVGALYEEGNRKDRSSDSSRRTFHSTSRTGAGVRSGGWSGYNSALDNSFVANLNKLWSEKIEIFAPVEFTRVSILTGVIKISLKTLLECIRLQTFGRFGFQQVQVDIHYLRTYLWSYVMDEQILNALLDEVLTSASVRATDAEIMDSKLVEFICEQN